jgi:putative FmdB family regulatory protein
LRRIGAIATADAGATLGSVVPIYEFECSRCGSRFEELLSRSRGVACPQCGSRRTARRFSPFAPPSRQPGGAKVRDSEARRAEREAGRSERLAEARKRRL